MQASKISLVLAATLAFTACGGDNGQKNTQPDGGYGAYRLGLVGTRAV